MKKLAKQLAPPTRAQLGLVEAAAAIRENPDAAEIGFMARQLILCTLPHSDPEKPKRHVRCIVCKARLYHFKADGKAADLSGLCVSCNERLKLTKVQPTTNPVTHTTVEQWTRRSGNLILGITPGRDFENNCSIGYPYGVIPRLLLLWIITEAVHTRSRRLLLGRSLADFMRGVGLSPNTGRGKEK